MTATYDKVPIQELIVAKEEGKPLQGKRLGPTTVFNNRVS